MLQREYLAWAQGFMSGAVMSSAPGIDEKLNLIPPAFPLLMQLEFLREYCVKNAEKDFVDAVIALHMKLRELK